MNEIGPQSRTVGRKFSRLPNRASKCPPPPLRSKALHTSSVFGAVSEERKVGRCTIPWHPNDRQRPVNISKRRQADSRGRRQAPHAPRGGQGHRFPPSLLSRPLGPAVDPLLHRSLGLQGPDETQRQAREDVRTRQDAAGKSAYDHALTQMQQHTADADRAEIYRLVDNVGVSEAELALNRCDLCGDARGFSSRNRLFQHMRMFHPERLGDDS